MSITVVLTTKGRHLHTLRWLWHHNRIGLPFEVIIADGEVVEPVARLLDDRTAFPNLRYRYLRYDDRSRADFRRKLADVTGRVETPYLFLSDNDDFILPGLLGAAARFLDGHPDYLCAGGPVGNFAVWNALSADPLQGVTGDLYSVSYDRMTSYEEPEPMQRLQRYFDHRSHMFYFVNRADFMHETFCNISNLKLHSFDTWEHSLYLGMLLRGKTAVLPGMGYFRQIGTSQTHASNRGWINQLFFGDWMADFTAMANTLAADAQRLAAIDPDVYRTWLRQRFCDMIGHGRAVASVRHSRLPFGLRERLRDIGILRTVKRRRRLRAVERHLADLGADPAGLTQFRCDMAAVSETLAGPAFRRFVADRAPELLR